MPVQTRSQTRKLLSLSRDFKENDFVKLTNGDRINRGYLFKEGLNEDFHELNHDEECAQGGIYFCRFKDIGKWARLFGHDLLIWRVDLPEGEDVIVYKYKCKAKRIILSEPQKAYENHQVCKKIIKENGNFIRFVKNQTPDLCKLAIKKNGENIRYVPEQTPELCKLAVRQNPWSIGWIDKDNRTPELCKLAVSLWGSVLHYVPNQTPELCYMAVRQNPFNLMYVREQTVELCKLAYDKNPKVLMYINSEFLHLFQ